MLLRGYAIILLATVPFVSWAYHTHIFNPYMAGFVDRAGEVLDRVTASYEIAKLSSRSRDRRLVMPVHGVAISQVADTYGDPRDGGARTHKGIDIFAKRGTPVYAVVPGFVMRVGTGGLGGKYVYIVGAGGVRYYYAHLDRFGENIKYGTKVTTETIIGYVGNTGNAINTPPHLHFGMYLPNRGASNPFNMIVDREESRRLVNQ